MDKKHELTEKLKVIENEVYDKRVELNSIRMKLQGSIDYEIELDRRKQEQIKKTEQLRKDFFIKANEVTELYKDMKSIMEIYTGNFFRPVGEK